MGRLQGLSRGIGHIARRLRWSLIAGVSGMLLLIPVLLAMIVLVPPLAIDPSGLTRDQWLTQVQNLRTTVLQAVGGVVVATGAIVAALNFRETSRQNRAVQEQNRAVLELQQRGQVTERFTRAIDQLGQRGDERLDVRIGAVYALEQIARDSADLHWPIMEVLAAYLREHARVESDVTEHSDTARATPPTDHQAVATVIGRRRHEGDPPGQRLDLRGAYLSDVRWMGERADLGAHLERADLRGAHLEGADLSGAHLEMADLRGAHLVGAHLEGADLSGAHLEGADLSRAYLEKAVLGFYAHLERAYFVGAHLEGADLSSAYLGQANLVDAHLDRAVLRSAHLEGADLRSAHLEQANLWDAHLEGADLRSAHLEQANLMSAHLEGADISGAHLERADLGLAHLEQAVLREAHLEGTNLLSAEGLTFDQLQAAADAVRASLVPYDLARRLREAAQDQAQRPPGPPVEPVPDEPS